MAQATYTINGTTYGSSYGPLAGNTAAQQQTGTYKVDSSLPTSSNNQATPVPAPANSYQAAPLPQIKTDSIVSAILGGQVDPTQLDNYIGQQIQNQYRTTMGGGTGDNAYLNAYNENAPALINQVKQQLQGKNIVYGGQSYQVSNGQAIKTSTTSNKSVVGGGGTNTTTSATGTPTYTVKQGDNLSQIASQNGMSLNQLLQLNPQFQSNPNLIQPGQTVTLAGTPGGGTGNNSALIQLLTNFGNQQFGSGWQNGSGSSPTSQTPPAGGTQSTGNSSLDAIQKALNDQLSGQLANGYAVNPALQITPDLVNQFINQAHSQLDPYYQQLLNSESANINATLQKLSTDYQTQQQQSALQFQQQLGQERQASAGNGVAGGGGQRLQEQDLLAGQNLNQQSLNNAYGYQIGNQLRAAGQEFGSGIPGLTGSANSFNLPSLATQSTSLSGTRGGTGTNGSLNYNYNPGMYQYGTIGGNYGSDLAGQANQFLSSYQTGANNNSRTFQAGLNGTVNLL